MAGREKEIKDVAVFMQKMVWRCWQVCLFLGEESFEPLLGLDRQLMGVRS